MFRGRNKEGQCGTSEAPVLLRPTKTAELDCAVKVLAAGRNHSGAVLANGEVFTWGSGLAGKLGLGNTQDILQPSRFAGAPFQQLLCLRCGLSCVAREQCGHSLSVSKTLLSVTLAVGSAGWSPLLDARWSWMLL